MTSRPNRADLRGFTLIEIVIVLAIVAVMAGAMVPYAVNQIESARASSTENELVAIRDGVRAYARDTGVVPSDRGGLNALVNDVDRRKGWDGPYVSGVGDIASEIQTDAWGEPYVYAADARVAGMGGRVDFIVISRGEDRVLNSTVRGGVHRLDYDADVVLIGSAEGDGSGRDDERKTRETGEKLDDVTRGLTRYYVDTGEFPRGKDGEVLGELVRSNRKGWAGPYVEGTAASVALDGWGRGLRVRRCREVNGEKATGWILYSEGAGSPNPTGRNRRWTTTPDDIHRVVTLSALRSARNAVLIEVARREIVLLAGDLYEASPKRSPRSFITRTQDPWGKKFRYEKRSAYGGVLYSFGPDRRNDRTRDDDIVEALTWSP